jgi:hypothetical protein
LAPEIDKSLIDQHIENDGNKFLQDHEFPLDMYHVETKNHAPNKLEQKARYDKAVNIYNNYKKVRNLNKLTSECYQYSYYLKYLLKNKYLFSPRNKHNWFKINRDGQYFGTPLWGSKGMASGSGHNIQEVKAYLSNYQNTKSTFNSIRAKGLTLKGILKVLDLLNASNINLDYDRVISDFFPLSIRFNYGNFMNEEGKIYLFRIFLWYFMLSFYRQSVLETTSTLNVAILPDLKKYNYNKQAIINNIIIKNHIIRYSAVRLYYANPVNKKFKSLNDLSEHMIKY